jgi:AcrR family transcriptional regulator
VARPPLSGERIAEEALRHIDDVGIEGFSMRGLASRLRVDPMSLYHYVPSRAALLDEVVDLMMKEADLPTGGLRWQEWVRTSAKRFVSLASTHPRAFPLFQSRGLSSPDAFRPMEALADALIRGGFAPDETWEIVLVFSNYVAAVGLGVARALAPPRSRIVPAEPQRDRMSPEEFPRMHEIAKDPTTMAVFTRGLETLIAGFEGDIRRRKRSRRRRQ